jgi:hypothetical protein
MKTIKMLKAEIKGLEGQMTFKTTKAFDRKIGQEIELREKAIEFLRTKPREQYLRSTLGRLKRKMELGRKDFERWHGVQTTAKEWRHYKKDSGLVRVEEFIHKIQIMVGGY